MEKELSQMNVWNEKIKTVVLTEDKKQVVVEETVINIINNPNRHRVESVIYSLCKGVAELANRQIEADERILKLQKELGIEDNTVSPNQTELPLFDNLNKEQANDDSQKD